MILGTKIKSVLKLQTNITSVFKNSWIICIYDVKYSIVCNINSSSVEVKTCVILVFFNFRNI